MADIRLVGGLTLKEAIDLAYDSDEENIVSDIYFEPPDSHVLTDEDSGDEDEGGLVDNLSSRQLNAAAEIVFTSNSRLGTADEIDESLLEEPTRQHIHPIASSLNIVTKPNESRFCIDGDILPSNYSFPESDYSAYINMSFVEIFELFFTEELLELILKETRNYALFKNAPDPNITMEELRVFFGILALSGYNQLPSKRSYWETSPDMRNELVVNAMRRDRFLQICRYIHFADNNNIDPTDKMYKMRPVSDYLKEKFMHHFVPEQNLSYDESMIRYFGRHGCKQFIRGKPIRFGYKVWCLNAPSGYLINFEIYQGRNPRANPGYEALFGKCAAPLIQMIDELRSKSMLRYNFFFDNLFTGSNLLCTLKANGYGATGTIRDNRLPRECPLENKKILEKQKRGNFSSVLEKNSGIQYVRWLDNKAVTVASTEFGVSPIKNVERFSRSERKNVPVPRPNVILHYNKNMGGTDQMDNNVSNYRTGIRSKKWNWPIFTFHFDVAVQNAWIIFRKAGKNISQLECRRSIAQQPTKVTPELPTTTPSPQSTGPFLVRPPLNRTDSRQNFQYRPPFPVTNVPSGPHSISPQAFSGYQPPGSINSGPQSLGPQILSGYQTSGSVNSGPHSIGPQILSGQQVRPPPPAGTRPPISSQQFVQRGPPLGPGGTQAPRLQQGNNQQHRPVFRPQSPFSRPPLLAQRPQIFQQSSVPAYNRPRPLLEETLNRSQTLDSIELENQKHVDDGRSPLGDQRPPSAASLERSFSATASHPSLERKLTGSQESVVISRQSSVENVHKKDETIPTSRPESRSGSRMGKIIGDNLNISRPESRGEVINGEAVSSTPVKKSPQPIIPPSSPEKKDIQEEPKKKDLDLNLSKSNKGDNDSGVDESTQGNDQSCNGDSRLPRKPTKSRTSSTTPTKGRSLSRGSKTPSSLQSPDSAATTPGSAEKKKVPMNKIQVGSAPSPNLKVVKSKIGSLENAHYKPGGGKVKIESKKLDFKNAGPRIEAKNDKYIPKGGERKEQSARSARSMTSPMKEVYSARGAVNSTSPRKIVSQKLQWNAKSKIGSLENTSHKPKGGDKKIETVKLDFKEKAAPKVGSKDNIKYQPGGGNVKIENKKIELHAASKVGSLDNVKHKPAGGDKRIFDDKDYLKQHISGKSSLEHSLSGSQHSIQSQEARAPVADENLNQEH